MQGERLKLTALLLLSVSPLVLSGCGKFTSGADAPPAELFPPASKPPVAASKPDRAGRGTYAYRLTGVDCLVNSHGSLRKVQITTRGVKATKEPGGSETTGDTLHFFLPYYVFEVSNKDDAEPAYFKIGSSPRSESVIGWVGRSVVACWDNSVGVRKTGRVPLLVYGSFEAVRDRVVKGETSEPPIARAQSSRVAKWMPWTVQSSTRFTHEGKSFEALQINFLGQQAAGGGLTEPAPGSEEPPYSPEEIAQFREGIREIDLVFCVDNTSSTKPFIQAIRAAVEQIAKSVATAQNVKLRVGLVLYRDYVPAILFPGGEVTAVRDLTEDLDRFCSEVQDLKEAQEGSNGLPEAVYDGVDAALEKPRWRPSKLNTRVLILIGDNSAHEPGSESNPKNLSRAELAQRAKSRGCPIISLLIDGAGAEAERELHKTQFEQLAKLSGGEFHRIDEALDVATKIRQILDERAKEVEKRMRVFEQLSKDGLPPEDLVAGEQTEEEISDVMEFLASANIDVRRLSRRPSFSTGWILSETADGTKLVEPHYLMSLTALDMLNAELGNLAIATAPKLGPKTLELRTGLLDPNSYFSGSRRATPVDVHLQSLDIPCPNGVLTFNRDELDHLSEEARARLSETILKLQAELHKVRTDNAVFRDFGDGVATGWVPAKYLP